VTGSRQLERLEQLACLGRMLAGIAHELNTPVGAVISMYDTMERCLRQIVDLAGRDVLAGEDLQELRRSLARLDEAAPVMREGLERIQALARELRLAGRPDAADGPEPVALAPLLDRVLLLLNHELKRSVTVQREYAAQPVVSGRPGRLGQVFLNLLRNARQALGEGGTITIGLTERDGHAVVTVTDDGVGIPAADLERIFASDFTTKSAEEGTGLGLFLCRQIVDEHAGTIAVASEPGRGSTFTVTLPCAT